MPKRISKKDKETFLFDPRDSGGIDIYSQGLEGATQEELDFYKSLLPDKPKKEKKTYKEGLTKKDLEEIEEYEDKIKESEKLNKIFKETGKWDGKKITKKDLTHYQNLHMNNQINYNRKIKEIKFRPELKRIKKEAKKALKDGEITESQMEKIIEGSEKTLSDELELFRSKKETEKNKKPYNEEKSKDVNNLKQKLLISDDLDREEVNKGDKFLSDNDYENAKKEYMKVYQRSIKKPYYLSAIGSYYNDIKPEDEKKEKSKEKKSSNKYKLRSLQKSVSNMRKKKDGEYFIETDMNVRKGLTPATKRALRRSVIEKLDKEIEGSGLRKKTRKIILDLSSDEEPVKRKRGRPKKGSGAYLKSDSSTSSESESSSDEEDVKEYSKILKHLISHITDKKEKVDKRDFKQAKELIDKIKKKK